MSERILRYVSSFEHVLWAGLAKGRIDSETLAQIVRQFHTPDEPLAGSTLPLAPFLWALDQLPAAIQTSDTLWLVAPEFLSSGDEEVGEKRSKFEKIGPSEWVCAATIDDVRRIALALASLATMSLQWRERLVGEDLLAPLLQDLAYAKLSAEPPPLYDWAVKLAVALTIEPERLVTAARAYPELFDRVAQLSSRPFTLSLRTRGIMANQPSSRAVGLWQEVLRSLASLEADRRSLAVWVAPLTVTDPISPYVREVRPLLESWAKKNPELERLAAALSAGDEDAAYVCAELFCEHHPEVQRERDSAEAGAGIYTISDPTGVRLARICDTAELASGALDPRLGELGELNEAPLVLILNAQEADIGYVFERLLRDVRAEFRGIFLSTTAEAMQQEAPAVGRCAAAANLNGGTLVAAAPSETVDLPTLRMLVLPDSLYASVFTLVETDDAEYDAVASEARWMQGPLLRTLALGDLDHIPMRQTFWTRNSERDALVTRRQQCGEALRIWRSLLGLPDQPTSRPSSGRAPDSKPAKKEDVKGRLPLPHRFRV